MNASVTLPAAHHQRLEWLDALRGFTMLMVVTNHVYGLGFDTNTKHSMFMSLCLLFRMPLFFFISGFLAYKASFSCQALLGADGHCMGNTHEGWLLVHAGALGDVPGVLFRL